MVEQARSFRLIVRKLNITKTFNLHCHTSHPWRRIAATAVGRIESRSTALAKRDRYGCGPKLYLFS